MERSASIEIEFSSEAPRASKRITDVVAMIAIAMFVYLGGQVVPNALGLLDPKVRISHNLTTGFLLSIALLLFAWRRSTQLKSLIDAREAAEKLARELAVKDFTTGLFNRRFLTERLSSLCRNGSDITLLLIDLDHFKNVNDIYGHATGDALLHEVAKRICKASCSKRDEGFTPWNFI
jgi:predicted signal transduction protein with EAL and GGDEF domain